MGGNFLGTSALEACNLIESLVGSPPPTKEIKTEITLEDVIKRLDSMENFFLDNASKGNESIEDINGRITALETSNTLDTHNHRIYELEEAMETLSSTFSSIKTKKEKAFVGREQKFIYIPKPKPHNMPKDDGNDLRNRTPSWIPKAPIATNNVLDEIIDVDASSLGNT